MDRDKTHCHGQKFSMRTQGRSISLQAFGPQLTGTTKFDVVWGKVGPGRGQPPKPPDLS